MINEAAASLPVITQLILRLLPQGSSGDDRSSGHREPPQWPADLFAVAASVLIKTGGYWKLRSRPALAEILGSSELAPLIASYGLFDLDTNPTPGPTGEQHHDLTCLWNLLLQDPALDFASVADNTIEAALILMLVADGAAEGVGRANTGRPFADLILDEQRKLLPQNRNHLPHPHRSICRMVPESEVRVLPKTITPELGQTIRILSRHLSLIDLQEVETQWHFGQTLADVASATSRLNLLLVPFPYQIDEECFRPSAESPKPILGHLRYNFQLDQLWLNGLNRGEGLFPFLSELIIQAETLGETVHGIVLPELAIHCSAAKPLADCLAARFPQLRLFVTGTGGIADDARYPLPVNGCHVSVFVDGHAQLEWSQTKHHQWRLDGPQLEKYCLENRLDPREAWWESFDVSRECIFCSLDGGFSFTTLICEDLSRVEPALSIVRAVGPNIVIALLMDDCQKWNRWSASCARALAEDPGSSVLTLTSGGLIARSKTRVATTSPSIALWHSRQSSQTREIQMPWNYHAVLAKLSTSTDPQPEVSLTATCILQHPHPPTWAQFSSS